MNPDEPHIIQIYKDFAAIIFPFLSLLVTLVIAWYARKISLGKTVKEKQLELVMELITDLSNMEIFINDLGKSRQLTVELTELFYLSSAFKEFNQRKLIFIGGNSGYLRAIKIKQNPLLPKKISAAISRFNGINADEFIPTSDLNKKTDFILISSISNEDNEIEGGENIYSTSIDFPDFEVFHHYVINMFTYINEWLDGNGAGEYKFQVF